MAGLGGFHEIEVKGYTDWELQQALHGHNISLASIPADLQELIRRPRYCQLVCSHFREMEENADFTVERLIFLDARHRAQAKLGALTESQFIEIVRNLAKKYRRSPVIELADMRELWPLPDPDKTIYQQIIDGGLLAPKHGMGTRFAIERKRLVFGLGMLLADEVGFAAEKNPDRREIEHLISSWFEPHPEMDLKVEICGAALFHSLVAEEFPEIGRREILRYWLTLRNWNDTAQSAIGNYVVRCPEDFIAVADALWLSDRNSGAAQDFLAKAFIKHRDDLRLQPLLVAAVRRWMGFVHPEGPPFLRASSQHPEKIREEIEQRVGSPLEPDVLEICGESITVVQDDGLLRMRRLGWLIISAGHRIPFLDAFVSWAASSAVMGSPIEAELADWVIYLSDEPLEQLLEPAVERLLALKTGVAVKAAITLLWRIDRKRAERVCEETGDPQYRERQEMRALHAQDPCKSLFAWSDDDCFHCQERRDINPLRILEGLGDRIFNPQFELSASLTSRLADLLKFEPTKYRVGLWATIEDHASQKILPVLASRAPEEASTFIRKVIGTLPNRSRDNQYPLLISLPDLSMLFTEADIKVISSVLDGIHGEFVNAGNAQQDGERWDSAEAFTFLSTAPHISSAEFFSRLIGRPPGTLDLYRFEPWFDALPADRIEHALQIIHSPPDELTLVRTLWFLAESKITLSNRDRDRIVALVQSPSPSVRSVALRFVYLGNDIGLRERVVDLGSSCYNRGGDSAVVWGARVLVRSSTHLPFLEVALRLHPADAGYALVERNLPDPEVSEYAVLLDNTYNSILAAIDPALLTLPSIVTPSKYESSKRFFSEFLTEQPDLTFKNPDQTWRSLTEATPEPVLVDSKKAVEELNRLSRERVSAINEAWKTEAFQWFGWGFSTAALERICRDLPGFVRRWVEPAFQEGRSGNKIRLRLGTFLGALCPLLLEYDPPLGLKLWDVLRSGRTGPVVFDAARAAFEAPDNNCTEAARLELLAACNNDAGISRIAYLAEECDRSQWVHSTVKKLIMEPALWKKAKGLTLASFSNMKLDEFETYVNEAGLGKSWVASQLPRLRKNLLKNEFAQQWFNLFLAGDELPAWGALQMLLSCGDHRFFTWQHLYYGPKGLLHPRLKYIESMAAILRLSSIAQKRGKTPCSALKSSAARLLRFLIATASLFI